MWLWVWFVYLNSLPKAHRSSTATINMQIRNGNWASLPSDANACSTESSHLIRESLVKEILPKDLFRVKIQLNLIPRKRRYFSYHLQQDMINHRNLCGVLGETESCEWQNTICNDNSHWQSQRQQSHRAPEEAFLTNRVQFLRASGARRGIYETLWYKNTLQIEWVTPRYIAWE